MEYNFEYQLLVSVCYSDVTVTSFLNVSVRSIP